MLELNLLPDVKINFLKTQSLKHSIVSICIIVSIVFLALFGAFIYYVYIYQKNEISNQNTKITSYIAQIKSNKNLDKILTIQNQLNSLPNIESQTTVPSRLFGFISQFTPTKATISDLNVDLTSNSITLNGSADSLSTVNQFVDTLKFTTYNTPTSKDKTAFSSVSLASFSYSSSNSNPSNSAQYSISFNYDPALLSNSNTVNLIVPNITTTRSILNQPLNLFKANSTKG